jgi:hypothetical protein
MTNDPLLTDEECKMIYSMVGPQPDVREDKYQESFTGYWERVRLMIIHGYGKPEDSMPLSEYYAREQESWSKDPDERPFYKYLDYYYLWMLRNNDKIGVAK